MPRSSSSRNGAIPGRQSPPPCWCRPRRVLFVSAADLIEDRDAFLDDFRNAAIAAERGAWSPSASRPVARPAPMAISASGEPVDGAPDVWRVALRREAGARRCRSG